MGPLHTPFLQKHTSRRYAHDLKQGGQVRGSVCCIWEGKEGDVEAIGVCEGAGHLVGVGSSVTCVSQNIFAAAHT